MQHQPVLAVRIWLTRLGRLVARAVSEIEELSIELGQSASVRAVQDDLPQDRRPSTGGAGISHVCDAARPRNLLSQSGRRHPSDCQFPAVFTWASLLAGTTPSRPDW